MHETLREEKYHGAKTDLNGNETISNPEDEPEESEAELTKRHSQLIIEKALAKLNLNEMFEGSQTSHEAQEAWGLLAQIVDGKIQTSVGMIKHYQNVRLHEIHRRAQAHSTWKA